MFEEAYLDAASDHPFTCVLECGRVEIATSNLYGDPPSVRDLGEANGDIAAAAGKVHNSHRPSSEFLRQSLERRPEVLGRSGKAVDSAQAAERLAMQAGLETRLVHYFRSPVATAERCRECCGLLS